ncbi:unnamed protein product [Cylicocyclus nassatus]|uniref:Uncharacterized protein n=1 Tax=Cylicocyclus nassatus TaxID=53992 RepID=A0AA36MCM6_CYLNA|nr:unnamed protein product [Cylicocyclus nassatus]
MVLRLTRLPVGLMFRYQRIILSSRTCSDKISDPYKRVGQTGGEQGSKVHTSKKFEDDVKSQRLHSDGGQEIHSTGGTPTGGDSGLRNKLIMAASLLLFSYLVYRFYSQSKPPHKAVREAEFGVRDAKKDGTHNKIWHDNDKVDPPNEGKVSVTNYGIHPMSKSDKADEVATNLLHGSPPGSTKQ